MTFIVILFKILAPTAQKTHYISNKNTSRVMLFRGEKIAVYTENCIHPIKKLSARNANFLMLKRTVYTGFPRHTGQNSGACSTGHLEQGITIKLQIDSTQLSS
jgi:hypothetical protein